MWIGIRKCFGRRLGNWGEGQWSVAGPARSGAPHAAERASRPLPHGPSPTSMVHLLLPDGPSSSPTRVVPLMYSVYSEHEVSQPTVFGGDGGVGVEHGVRFDWASAAAFARIA